MNVMKVIGKTLVVLALIALIGLGIVTLQKFATEPRDAYLQGQMEARRVLVAG
jgi:HlyD family secretion protein